MSETYVFNSLEEIYINQDINRVRRLVAQTVGTPQGSDYALLLELLTSKYRRLRKRYVKAYPLQPLDPPQ